MKESFAKKAKESAKKAKESAKEANDSVKSSYNSAKKHVQESSSYKKAGKMYNSAKKTTQKLTDSAKENAPLLAKKMWGFTKKATKATLYAVSGVVGGAVLLAGLSANPLAASALISAAAIYGGYKIIQKSGKGIKNLKNSSKNSNQTPSKSQSRSQENQVKQTSKSQTSKKSSSKASKLLNNLKKVSTGAKQTPGTPLETPQVQGQNKQGQGRGI